VLFEARAKRQRPHLDDKIITSWNGMMIAAFARAARVLPGRPDAPRYLATARSAAGFIRDRLWNAGDQRLLRRYRDGEAAIDAYAEDYASLVWGLLELFQADGNAEWLEWARALQARQDALFWDEAEAGWFSTTGTDPSVLLRLKEDYDGAEPSASAMSVLNLIVLAHLLDDEEARRKAERTLARYGPKAGRAGRVIPLMLAGLSSWHATTSQVVVLGEHEGQDTATLKAEVARHYLPFAVVIPVAPGEQQARVAALMPFIAPMRMHDGAATAFVCRNFTCLAPVTTPDALAPQLEER